MRDVLPDEVARWQYLEETARAVFSRYGFREIRTPLLEATELFARSVGADSDIVRKEMYTLDRGDESMSLRPESTASVVRAFVEHALHRNVAQGYPERLYYIGPMFRYERPQKGRQRQFHQIGAEVLGAPEPLADAETLEMLDAFLDRLGIAERELLVGSVGDATCRPAYRERLRAWLEPRLGELCGDCRRRFEDNPLRVFDCKVAEDQRLLRAAPLLTEHLCPPCEAHFAELRSLLDRFGIRHRVEPRLVRGLDYYERTVFEVVAGGLGAQNAILGGGRYDGLVEQLGGPSLPALGFALGMERTILLLAEDRVAGRGFDAAVVALGGEGFRASIDLTRRLRRAGLRVLAPLAERPMGAQLRRAERAGARFAIFIGRDEVASARYGLKDLRSGEQAALEESAIVARLGEPE
jgi:histidyl-tRNA synthetase